LEEAIEAEQIAVRYLQQLLMPARLHTSLAGPLTFVNVAVGDLVKLMDSVDLAWEALV